MSTRPYTDIPELLVLLSEKNILIKLKNENIELIDVDKNLNQELINQIKVRKSEIIQFLKLYEKKEEYVAIPIAKTKEYYALSSMQKRLYFLWEIDKTLTNYNMPDLVLLEKPISKEKLTSIIKAISQRHEMLRASFHYFNENHYLKIADNVLPDIDCIETDEENVLQTIKNFVQPFDLNKAPLLRIQLVNIKNGAQLLLIDIHHIISDGISNGILKKEFLSLFYGNALEPIKIQYKDFTEWQNSEEYKEVIGRQEKYWLDQYSNEVNALQLPTDFLRPKNQSFIGDDVRFTINKNLSDSLKKITKDNGGTPFITLLSIFNILLYKLTDQEDIVIGVPVAGRNHPDLGKIIGFFINTLALRNETKGEITFTEFCEQVKGNTLKAFDNQDYGVGELVDRINVNRDSSRNPLFDVMFNLLSHRESKSSKQSSGKYSELYKIAKFDLTLTSTVGEDEILCSFNYSTSLFKRTTIQRFVKYFLNIIEAVSNNGNIRVSDIEILSESERNQLLNEFNDTKLEYPKDKTIIDLFEAQVKSTPFAIAVKKANNQISFLELNNRANRIGKLLRDKGVARNDIVAIIAERSIDMIIGIYGILKAGAAYLPIDPNYPDERKALMIDKSKCKVLLTKKHLQDKVSEELLTIILDDKEIYNGKCGELKNISTPNDLIYVIFTSGSTGIPKGSAIKNRTFVNLIYWYNKELEVSSKDNILLMASISFDLAQKNLFVFLLNGACLHLSEENNLNYEEVANNIEKNNISIINCAPIAFYQLLSKDINDNFRNLSGLRKVMLGGEPINKKMFTEWRATQYFNTDVINSYGPTECTDVVTFHTVEEEEWNVNDSIPIGNPIDNASIYILNKNNQINPVGIAGELCIGGTPVSDGYLYDPLLTKEKFVKNLFGEGLMYKTGDLAKWLSNGKIEYLGRIDHQIKIRGIRIELGEIEATLLKHEKIEEAVVIAAGDKGEEYICAYIVSEEELDTNQLRLHLSKTLPDSMLPSYFVRLESIPLTPNRKIDKKALPEPKFEEGDGYEGPSNEIEEKLVAIWSEVLKIDKERISINRSFFELGGHSLKATILTGKIYKEIGVEFPLRDVFSYTSIKAQASQIAISTKKEFVSIPKAKEQSNYPLSSAQKRLYLIQQFDLTSTAYNMPNIISLGKEADKGKIEEVFKQLINRHESFRTNIIIVDNEPVQIINKEVDFELEELTIENTEVKNVRNKFIKPFDLLKAPLLRVAKVDIKGNGSLLMIDMHHIISDGVSHAILEREFHALYSGEELLPLSLQYKDYSEWQNSEKQQEIIKDQEQYWLNKFEGEIPVLNLPIDYIRPSYLSNEGNMITVPLSPKQTRFVRSLCEETGTTLYMNMLSIFSVLLSKLGGQDKFIVGLSVAGRKHPDLQKIVGMFVNSLPIEVNPNKNKSYNEFLLNIKNTTLNAYENQDYQFDDLVNKLNIQREPGRNPVFDVMLNMIEASGDKESQFNNKEEYQLREDVGRRFDLTLNITNSKNEIILGFQYYPKIFNSETIIRFAQYFKNIITLLERDSNQKISEIELLTKAEKELIQNKLGEKIIRTKSKLPISFHQERIWFIDKFEKNNLYKSSPIYHNIPLILGIEGKVDLILLEKSIQHIISRHDILRSKFYIEEEKLYHDILDKREIKLEEIITTESEKEDLVNSIIDAPFDLKRDLLLRAALLTITEKEQALVLVVHHIISDRYSLKLIAKEILEYYHALRTNKPLVQAKLPICFTDYIYWQRETYPVIKEHLLSYWKPQLRGKVQALEMPEDTKRAAIHIFKAGEYTFDLPEQLTKSLYEYASIHNFSIDVILLGFYKLMLGRYTNQKEIVVGTNVEGRDNDLTKHLVGPVSNLIVLRSFIDFEEDFITYISKLNNTIKEALEYKEIPFDRLVSEINPEKDMSRTALFDFLFHYEEIEPNGEIGVNYISSNLGLGKYDQNLLFQKNGNELRALLVYNTEYYRKESIHVFFDHYIQLITNTLKKSDQKLSDIEILSKEEKHQLLYEFNDTKADYPKDKTIHQLFEEQVKRTPENIAISNKGNKLTYNELNKKANLVAQQLREIGIERDDIVSIFLDRSIETVYSMLGVLKSGGAYLPLDPDYPDDRIDFILNDSQSKIVISTKDFSERIEFEGRIICVEDLSVLENNISNIETINKPSDLCYIIYTSGTTGMPKGVMIEHRNAVRLFFNEKFQFDFSEKDVWTMFHSHCFDFSVWEMYGALLYGGKLIVVPKIVARDVVEYYKLLQEEKVSVLNQTPSAFYNLSELALQKPGKSLENLRYIIFGGEALKPNKLAEWFNIYSDVKLINMYGITETTVHVTYKEIGKNEIENNISNIGTSIPTLTTYVVDNNLKLVPKGVAGELLIGGDGLSRGYLGREDLTKEKFIKNPYNPEERLYCSGDLVKMLSNGELEYLGRIDDQVQLRGFRIELGEIENTLLKHQRINECVVSAREENGDKYLCAYIVCEGEFNQEEIRTYLLAKLTDYMIPSYFVQLDKIPLTSNGKINHKLLPSPEVKAGDDYVAPSNEIEEKLVEIWSKVLNINKEDISVNANFFSIGGHSLKATVLTSNIHKELGVEFPLRDVFIHSSIQAQASQISTSDKKDFISISKVKEQESYVLSSAQKRLYLLQQMDLDSTAYSMPYSIPLGKDIDKNKIESVFQELISRHESFRTSFEIEGEAPVQRIHNQVNFHVEQIEIDKSSENDIRKEFIKSFDLSQAPLLRVAIIDVKGERKRLLIDMHHIISDGVSQSILEKEFQLLYSGEILSELRLNYKDYSHWQQSEEQQSRLKEQEAYWIHQFDEKIPVLNLPTDYNRPVLQSSRGANVSFILSKEETKQIKQLTQDNDLTLYMGLLSIYSIFLSRISGQKDIIVGTPIAGRNHADLEDIVGIFINTLAIRNNIDGDKSLGEYLQEIKQTTLGAFENQDYQFEDLVEKVSVERDTSRNPIFDVMFNMLNQTEYSEELSTSDSDKYIHQQSVSKVDLKLSAIDYGENIRLIFNY
ncbi:MAG: amino acid adenylation domain-containing protein, partial [Bacteroidales bacterium]|nr:amino acid adenylation domain-containing protein [Bacteroidales bacterium]